MIPIGVRHVYLFKVQQKRCLFSALALVSRQETFII